MLDQLLRQVTEASEDKFRPYDRYGDPVPGMEWITLSGEPGNGDFECFLLRMEPGTISRPHEHAGHEEFFVLEGSFVDYDGREFLPGEYVHYLPGSKHSSSSPKGCKLLVVLRGGNNRALTEQELSEI